MDIIKDVFAKITWHDTLKSVTDKGVEKMVASAVGATVLDLGTIFLLFVGLEIVDIFTRLMAISRKYWENTYGAELTKQRGSLLSYIRWIPDSHRFRYINSTQMRDGFWSKTIVYFILIFVGFLGDTILSIKHMPQFVLVIFCGILVCTETLSILENLGECGVSSVEDIKNLIRKRKDSIK